MITLKKVSENDYKKVIGIKLNEVQSKFAAANVYSLAQAYIYPNVARPFTIYNDEEVIGFIMLAWDEEENKAYVWRLVIAEEQQNKGYGRKALELAINMVKESKKFDCLCLDYVPENIVAKHLCESLGFEDTGEMEGNQKVMKINFN